MKIHVSYDSVVFIASLFFISFFLPFELIATIILVVVVPGYFILSFVETGFSFPEKLILGFGLGIGLLSFLGLVFNFLNIEINASSTGFAIFLLLSAIFYIRFKNRRVLLGFRKGYSLFNILLVLIFFMSFFSRIYPVHQMGGPLFADPAVVGTISKLIRIHGTIPETLEPYAHIENDYPPGLPVITSVLSDASGLNIPRTLLFLTNIFHAMLPFSVFVFASMLFKNRSQALAACLLTMVAAFPTYIFVAGMNSVSAVYFMVPVFSALVVKLLEKWNTPLFFLFFIISSGSVAIHPFFSFFIFAVLVSLFLLVKKGHKDHFKKLFVVGLVFLLSFIFSIMLNGSFEMVSARPSVNVIGQWTLQSYYINPEKNSNILNILSEPFFLFFGNPNGRWYFYIEEISFRTLSFLFSLAFFAVFLLAIRNIIRKRIASGYAVFLLYLLFILFGPVQALFAFKFPGWYFLYPSRIKFFLIFPLSLLLSFGFVDFQKKAFPKSLKTRQLLFLLFFVPVGLGYITMHLASLSAMDPLSSTEMQAIEWITENTPMNATILNFLTDVEYGAFIGYTGQWIPVLADRPVVFPATSLAMNTSKLAERVRIMDSVEEEITDGRFLRLIGKYNTSYIFVNERMVRHRGTYRKVLHELFDDTNLYEPVFQNKNIFIFRVKYP
jgi:hypothetical protein